VTDHPDRAGCGRGRRTERQGERILANFWLLKKRAISMPAKRVLASAFRPEFADAREGSPAAIDRPSATPEHQPRCQRSAQRRHQVECHQHRRLQRTDQCPGKARCHQVSDRNSAQAVLATIRLPARQAAVDGFVAPQCTGEFISEFECISQAQVEPLAGHRAGVLGSCRPHQCFNLRR